MRKITQSLLALLLMLVGSTSAMAADPDLSGYTLTKTITFNGDGTKYITVDTSTKIGKVEGGADCYKITDPDFMTDYVATNDGSTKSSDNGLRITKDGLYAYGGGRSVIFYYNGGAIPQGAIVKLTCNRAASTAAPVVANDAYTYAGAEADEKVYYFTMVSDGMIQLLLAKNTGYITKVEYYLAGTVLVLPTAEYTKVDGISRTVTFKGTNLAYNTDGSDTYTNFTDAEGNFVNEAEVTVDENTTYYVVSTNGEEKSDVLSFSIEAGTEISVAVPTYTITSIAEGWAKTYSVSIDNSKVLLKPTAKLTYRFEPSGEGEPVTDAELTGEIKSEVPGTYTITASAPGYASTQLVITNDDELESFDVVDVTALDPTTISENWKKYAEPKVVGSSSQWAGKGFPDALDAYWYDFASETAAETDILKGLSLEVNAEGKTPQLFTTLGLMYPVHVLDAEGAEQSSPAITTAKVSIAEPEGKYAVITYRPGYGTSTTTIILKGDEVWDMNRFDKAITKYELFKEKSVTPEPAADDYTSYIANADLKGEGGWNAEGTKGIDQSGIVKCGNNAQYDFSQTIASLPAGQYVLEVKAAYRYSGSEADEYAAIQAGTETKLAELYATIGENTVTAAVKNRYDGASATDHAQGNGSVQVNDLWVPNSSAAVQAWFAAGAYANELSLIVTEESSVTIGIRKSAQPEAGDYTVIGPWTLTRLGDVVADAIATVKSEQPTREGIYNLAGQRVMKAAKGLYIINGKKVVK